MEGLSELEWRTHFSLWAMAAAPLWVGIDRLNRPEAALQLVSESLRTAAMTTIIDSSRATVLNTAHDCSCRWAVNTEVIAVDQV